MYITIYFEAAINFAARTHFDSQSDCLSPLVPSSFKKKKYTSLLNLNFQE